ncbi:hypothetical protein VTJ04DRAFT_191 [Mycothermus thermophilus]|uniref:uncharacterized protein n=1 Tax=Humicola insolens TaxID=85995 RepID=UPI0037436FD5
MATSTEGQDRSSASESTTSCPGAGDVFRTIGLPDKFMVGLDALAITTSKSFAGFRDIPPGTHLLWVQQIEGVSRCGYWFVTNRTNRAVRVKEWDSYNETLGDPTTPHNTNHLESVSSDLKPYTLHDRIHDRNKTGTHWSLGDPLPEWAREPAKHWCTLTSNISLESLTRITGKDGLGEIFVDSTDVRRDEDAPNNNSGFNFLFLQDFRDLQVLDLTGNRSARSEDTSARIEALLSNNQGRISEQGILAELQFTFLTGTHIGNAACLEQWWNLVLKILLRAYHAAITRPRFTAGVIRTLHAQLLYTEYYFGSSSGSDADNQATDEDKRTKRDGPSSERPIFQYKPHNREKLRLALIEYKRRVSALLSGLGRSDNRTVTGEHRAVVEALEELEAWLWRWNWDLRADPGKVTAKGLNMVNQSDMPVDSDEEEDDQPVVVELDEDGREVGMVSFRD